MEDGVNLGARGRDDQSPQFQRVGGSVPGRRPVQAGRPGELLSALPKAEREAPDQGVSIEAQFGAMTTTWFRFFLGYDPRPTLAKVTSPVLALGGEKDFQVPVKENLAEITGALEAAGNEAVTVEELPGLNHPFQTCRTGAPSEYATIEETMAPAALKRIGNWVCARAGVK